MATQPKPGTVIVPQPGIRGNNITLHQENTYAGIEFHLGTGYQTLLETVGTKAFFTAKERFTSDNSENFFDVECTITDPVNGVMTADLDAENTDITPGPNYRWQIQVKSDADDSVVKVVLSGRLIIEATLLGVETP